MLDLKRLASAANRPRSADASRTPDRLTDDVPLRRCASKAEFDAMLEATGPLQRRRAELEQGWIGPEPSFLLPGTCPVCRLPADFEVDFRYSFVASDGRRIPNWREQLECPRCRLNSRMRASVLFLDAVGGRGPLYLTEQLTPLFRLVRRRFGKVVGSEFLRDGTAPGAVNAAGIRHQDLTRLTFRTGAFRCVASFDVLEHIPDYRAALREINRCLDRRGGLVLSVPFALDSAETIVRAVVRQDGGIEHLLPPEHHGDPLDPAGTLCFYHFGWRLLEEIRAAGFRDAALYFYWSRDYGLLAGLQFLIYATR